MDTTRSAAGVGRRQITVVALVLLALVIDGVDIQLLALTAPLILADWNVDRASFGPAMAAALVGMSFGASLGGYLGDRFGRKIVLVAATLVFGASTMAAAFSESTSGMALLRLVSGLGFGAAAPNGIALASEWLPEHARARAVSILSIGTPLGGMVGAGALIFLLPALGWQGSFGVCGAITLLVGIVMMLALPESPGFLSAKQRQLATGNLEQAHAHLPARIFTRANLRLNVGVWLCFFGISFVAYAFAAWLPVILTTAGFTLAQALRASFVFNLSAVTAAVVTGFIVNRVGSRAVSAGGSIGALGAIALIGVALGLSDGAASFEVQAAVFVASGGAGAFTGAALATIYTLLVSAYPVAIRAAGIGMGLMMGRFGAITSTGSGGALLSVQGSSTWPFFSALALCALAALAGTLVVDRHIAGSIESSA
jgi:AAHS family 4-hydroxybenzoate transporter-like MFS transporter